MNAVDELLARNAALADSFDPGRPMLPKLRTIIVTCPDPRVDPAHLLGVGLGEAAVLREIGGRITPTMLQSISLLTQLTTVISGMKTFEGLELMVIHHTDCGITRLHDDQHRDGLAALLGVEASTLTAETVDDPYATVVHDLDLLRASMLIPPTLSVTGLVHDIASGRTMLVERRAPLRPETSV